MTVVLVWALAVVAGVSLLFVWCLIKASIDVGNKDRARHSHDRELHTEQTLRLITDFGAERQRWDAERSVLLNRIQDPAGTAFASNVALIPPSGDMGVEITH